jgi:WD40 repeat protein
MTSLRHILLILILLVAALPAHAQNDTDPWGVEVVLEIPNDLEIRLVEDLADIIPIEWIPAENGSPRFQVTVLVENNRSETCTYTNHEPIRIRSMQATATITDLVTGETVDTRTVYGGHVYCPSRIPYTSPTFSSPDPSELRPWLFNTLLDSVQPTYLYRILHTEGGLERGHFSPDGELVVTLPDGGVWSLAAAERLYTIRWPGDETIKDALFTTDMTEMVVVGRVNEMGAFMVWDVATQAVRVETPVENTAYVTRVALSPNGAYAAGIDHLFGTRTWLWDMATGEQVAAWTGEESATSAAIAFNPANGHLLTLYETGEFVVRSVPDGEIVFTGSVPIRRQHLGAFSAAYSPDGQSIIIGTRGGTLHLMNANSGDTLGVLTLDTAETAAVFSPDGRYLAGVQDRPSFAARIWDMTTGEPPLELPDYNLPFRHVEFSPDGRYLLTAQIISRGGPNTDVRIWDLSVGLSE